MSRRGQTVDAHIFPSPDPVTVARIIETKGFEAAQERWHWCEKRTLMAIARSGRARSGIAPKGICTRSHVLDGREAVAVEAVFIIGSMAAVDVALDAGKNATRALFFKRGLDLPKGHSERVAEGMLGRRIRDGDATAVAEREAKQVHARAVCDVLAVALALVPGQPATGRYRLPPVDDALRDALEGLCPAAIEAVFPDLFLVADIPAPAPAEEAAPVVVPLPDPAIEVPAVTQIPETDPSLIIEAAPVRSRRKLPANDVLRADHAAGARVADLAVTYGVSQQGIYQAWSRLGLAGRGRFVSHSNVAAVQVRVTAPPVDVSAETVAPEPVAPPSLVDPYGALSPEEAISVVADIEAKVPLGLHHLALAVRLAAETGLSKAEAIEWVRADIHFVASSRVIPAEETVMTAAMADQIFSEILWGDERGTRQ